LIVLGIKSGNHEKNRGKEGIPFQGMSSSGAATPSLFDLKIWFSLLVINTASEFLLGRINCGGKNHDFKLDRKKHAGWVLTYQDHFQCHQKGGDLSSKILQHWNCVIITNQMITFQKESNLRAMYALNWIVCRLIHLRELRYSWDIPAMHLRYTCDTLAIHLRELAPVAWLAYTCVQPAHHLRYTCETHLRASAHKITICKPPAVHLRTCSGVLNMVIGLESCTVAVLQRA